MDIEERLRKLEVRYRAASGAASGAKALYLALAAEPTASPAQIARAKENWQRLDVKKREIASRLGEIESLESGA
jgi:hypothetical protein